MESRNPIIIDFALKLRYPFQYPNRSNPGIETQLATVEDWIYTINLIGTIENLEFIWEYIDHEQSKNV